MPKFSQAGAVAEVVGLEVRNLPWSVEGYVGYLTYREVAGESVEIADLCTSLEELPLPTALAFLAMLSRDMVSLGAKAFEPESQELYLYMALHDDFPAAISRNPVSINNGHLVFEMRNKVFVHHRNIAVLAQLVIMHCDEAQPSLKRNYLVERRLCRALLIINDYLDRAIPNTRVPTLIQRRDGILYMLSLQQHGHDPVFFQRVVRGIARQRRLYEVLKEISEVDIDEVFEASTGGVTIDETLRLLGLLYATVQIRLTGKATLLPRSLLHNPTARGAKVIAALSERWIRTVSEYKRRFGELHVDPESGHSLDLLDMQALRESPLIQVSDDSVACPSLLFLRDLIADAPYYIMVDALESKSEKQRFQTPIGSAFSISVERLLERIANGDRRGKWGTYHHEVIRKSGSDYEIADSILLRNGVAVVFEHKAQRPDKQFLSTASGIRVLGPSDSVLEQIETGKGYNSSEAKASAGWLLQGMWQQSLSAEEIVSWVRGKTGENLESAFPIIVHMYEPQVDSIARGVYIELLIEKARLYAEPFWRSPQWLHIGDLEKLAALADSGQLDLEWLLTLKHQEPEARLSRFGNFLSRCFDTIPVDEDLAEYGKTFLQGAASFLQK